MKAASLMFLAWVLTTAGAAPSGALESFETDRLSIETAAGERHDFTVELALTDAQRAQGLMYRRAMAADRGMLFLYQSDSVRTMWMKNTYMPLDMLFLDARGRIVHIAQRTVPLSLDIVDSRKPARAVLELNSGTASRLGLAVGDRVLYSAFATDP